MEPITAGIIGLVVLFILLAVGAPIGISMAVVGTAGLGYLVAGSAALSKLAIVPFSTVADYNLAVLPLFLLMAEVVFASGMGADLYRLAAVWLGRRRGGLAMATVAGCAGFAAVSASSIATTATMALVAKPEMDKYKYSPQLSTSVIAAGGSIGSLIPPSGILIVYGILTETSIGKLFIAGIIPGILEALTYIVTIYILCRINPALGPRGPKTTFKEKILAFKHSGEIIVLVVFVIGGMLIGWFTPTEAGAIGAAGAILVSLIRRRLEWQNFKKAILSTMRTTGMIYGILIGAFLINAFLAVSNLPMALASWVGGLPLSPLGILAVILVTYLILGCFLDSASMMVLTIPIYFPLVMNLGFDPIFFGILLVRMMEIGMITPPMGMNVFILAGTAPDVPMKTIYKGIVPFVIADIFNVILFLFFPALILFLPSLM